MTNWKLLVSLELSQCDKKFIDFVKKREQWIKFSCRSWGATENVKCSQTTGFVVRVSNVPHTHIHGSAHAHSHFDAHSHYLSLALALDLTRFVPLQLTVPNSLRYLYHTLFMSRFLSNSLSLYHSLSIICALSKWASLCWAKTNDSFRDFFMLSIWFLQSFVATSISGISNACY